MCLFVIFVGSGSQHVCSLQSIARIRKYGSFLIENTWVVWLHFFKSSSFIYFMLIIILFTFIHMRLLIYWFSLNRLRFNYDSTFRLSPKERKNISFFCEIRLSSLENPFRSLAYNIDELIYELDNVISLKIGFLSPLYLYNSDVGKRCWKKRLEIKSRN